MIDDQQRWNTFYKRNKGVTNDLPSKYAIDKEKLFPRNSLIVEMGGGTGEDALYFLKQGHRVVLLDISEFAINEANRRVKEVNLSDKFTSRQVDFNFHPLPIKDDSVDIVYSRISLNYFDSEHTTKLFSDIYRMLKKGGVSYLTFKSPEDKKEMDYLETTSTLYEPNVFIENDQLRSRFTKEQLKDMLVNAGIEFFEVNYFLENIGDRDRGFGASLHLNEIVIKK